MNKSDRFSHNCYHVEGVTDLSIIHAKAADESKRGGSVLVHEHDFTAVCAGSEHWSYVKGERVSFSA